MFRTSTSPVRPRPHLGARARMTILAGLAAMAWLAPASLAQEPVRREIQEVAVVKTDTGADAHVIWTLLLAEPAATTLNLSTRVQIWLNGEDMGFQDVSASAAPGSGFCGPCGGGCGTGYIDGVFNTLLCLEDPPGSFDCGCRFPSITTTIPLPPTEPGDELRVLATAVDGGEPGLAGVTIYLDLNQRRWDRHIVEVRTEPTPGAPAGTHDVLIDWSISSMGIAHEIVLTPLFILLVNGEPVGQYETPCGPWIASPESFCGICDGTICGSIKCNGQTVSVSRCNTNPDNGYCGCVPEETFCQVIPGVVIEPGDELQVLLRPVPGALPELPGFEDEEEVPTFDPWRDQGHALAGTHGDPVAVGEGTLVGGTPVTLTLGNALENSTAWWVLGPTAIYAPFKGGVMVPDPVALFPLPTGGAGTANIAGLWPMGLPGGLVTYMQFWIHDPAGPVGFSASNGLSATTP